MVKSSSLFNECTEKLNESGNDNSLAEVKWIFQSVIGNSSIFAFETLSDEQAENIRSIINKRCEGYPLQYLLGEWEFYGYPFIVNENVLIPRPDTETLIENVKDIVKREKLNAPKIADLCSGSGCIAVTLKKEIPDACVTAVELSEKAVAVIEKNAELNKADINIVNANVLKEETARMLADFDIIVSNPPYLTQEDMDTLQTEVTHEPSLALFGGNDGLDFYRAMTPLWKNSLKKGGWLLYEYGMGQHDDVKNILEHNNFENIEICRDLAGIFRTSSAQKTED